MKQINIEELNAQHEKSLEAAKAQNIALNVAAAHFEDIKSITPHSYGADYGLTLNEVETLQEAIERAENINPDALFSFKDGCLSFVPEEFAYNKRGADRATIECVGPWVYEVDKMENYPQTQKLGMYKTVGDYMFKVVIPVKADKLTYIARHDIRDHRNRIVETVYKLVNSSGHFNKVHKFYASQGTPNGFKLV